MRPGRRARVAGRTGAAAGRLSTTRREGETQGGPPSFRRAGSAGAHLAYRSVTAEFQRTGGSKTGAPATAETGRNVFGEQRYTELAEQLLARLSDQVASS